MLLGKVTQTNPQPDLESQIDIVVQHLNHYAAEWNFILSGVRLTKHQPLSGDMRWAASRRDPALDSFLAEISRNSVFSTFSVRAFISSDGRVSTNSSTSSAVGPAKTKRTLGVVDDFIIHVRYLEALSRPSGSMRSTAKPCDTAMAIDNLPTCDISWSSTEESSCSSDITTRVLLYGRIQDYIRVESSEAACFERPIEADGSQSNP